MKRVMTILCVGLLLLTISAGVCAAKERNIIVKSSYMVHTQWPDLEEAIDKGNFRAFVGPMVAAMFERAYPNVKIQPVPWKMWGPDAGERLRAALAAGEAPSFYSMVYSELGGPQGMINEGMVADITDLVKDWEQTKYIPRYVWQPAWRGDRVYGIPHRLRKFQVVAYRKDWFKEAGIFNAQGEPGPEDDWSWDDFGKIATKLTDPKKERWGTSLITLPAEGYLIQGASFGVPILRPDPSGKYTWRAAFNLEPGVELLQIYQNLMKNKVAITRGTASFNVVMKQDFLAHRAGMIPWYFTSGNWGSHWGFGPDYPTWDQLIGFAPIPRSPEGVRTVQVAPHLFGINPTQTKEEIEATFHWMDYLFAGPYSIIEHLLHGLTWGKKLGVSTNLTPYHMDTGGFVTDPQTNKAAHYVIDAYGGIYPGHLRIIRIVENDPVKPVINEHGMWQPNIIALNTALEAAISKVLTDANADPQTELDKAADVANRTALNVKLDGVTVENMKSYYTALGDFYQENFPKYYEEVFKGLFEEYYKVW